MNKKLMMIKIIIYPPSNQVELLNLIHLLFFNPRVDGLGNYFSKSVFENCFLKIVLIILTNKFYFGTQILKITPTKNNYGK